MTPLSPGQQDGIHARVQRKYQATLRQRLDALRDDLHAAIRRVDDIHRRYVAMRWELDQHEETTLRLPVLPSSSTAETERITRPGERAAGPG